MPVSAKESIESFSKGYKGRLDSDEAYRLYLEYCQRQGILAVSKEIYLNMVKRLTDNIHKAEDIHPRKET